jgi:hypothetical protein
MTPPDDAGYRSVPNSAVTVIAVVDVAVSDGSAEKLPPAHGGYGRLGELRVVGRQNLTCRERSLRRVPPATRQSMDRGSKQPGCARFSSEGRPAKVLG